jgi:hypothetical protein
MTLAEIIAAHEAAQPRRVILTPIGAAAAAVIRLRRQLEEMEPEDAYRVLELTADLSSGYEPSA